MAIKMIWDAANGIGADHGGIVWMGCEHTFLTEQEVADFMKKYDPSGNAEVRHYGLKDASVTIPGRGVITIPGGPGVTGVRWYPPTRTPGFKNGFAIYHGAKLPQYITGDEALARR